MSQPAVKRQRNTEMLRAPSVRDVGMSMLLLLAGRASVLGLFPFGVAFFASCFDKSIAYLGITVLSIALGLLQGLGRGRQCGAYKISCCGTVVLDIYTFQK